MITSPGGPLSVTLLDAVTAGGSQPIPMHGYTHLALYITASAAISAGTLIVEEAASPSYGGTWSQIASYTLSSIFAAAGGAYGAHLSVSAYAYVRVRIGTSVVGGTVGASLEAC